MLCGTDVAHVSAALSAAPFGALGGMYRIEAHRRQLAAARAADADADASGHGDRPSLDQKYNVASIKPATSYRVPRGPEAVGEAVGEAGEAPRRVGADAAKRVAITLLRAESTPKPTAARPTVNSGAGPGAGTGAGAGAGPRRGPAARGPLPAGPRCINSHHRTTGNGLPSWHSSSVPSTPLIKTQKSTIPMRRPSIGYISPKAPMESDNCARVCWSKGFKEPANLRFRRYLHPKGPQV